MLSDKTKKTLAIIYVILISSFFLYVRGVLKQQDVQILQKSKEQKHAEAIQIKVTLTILRGNKTQTIILDMTDNQTVNDILEHSRDNGQIYYEVVSYLDHEELRLDDLIPPKNMVWRIFNRDKDITDSFKSEKLTADQTYTIKLVTRSATPQ